jgi:FeS assembly SUF system protein
MRSSRASKGRRNSSRESGSMMEDVKSDDRAAEPVAAEAERTESGRIVPSVAASIPTEEVGRITADLIGALKTVYDPEIPVDIYELGLIYKVDLDDDRNLVIDMTLTAPGCPVAGEMPMWVENAVTSVAGVSGAKANLVFDPPWDQSRMSDEARVALDMW